MNFGVISLPQLNKHSLDTLNFPRGILVFLLGLVFFLGSTEQYKAMKIGITFFGSKMDLLCIYKVLSALCSVERLDAEWAGEAVRRGAGGTPASNGHVAHAGGEVTAV